MQMTSLPPVYNLYINPILPYLPPVYNYINPYLPSVCKYITAISNDDRKEAITLGTYIQYISDHVTGWPIGAFNALLEHVDSCAKAVPIGDQRQKIQ